MRTPRGKSAMPGVKDKTGDRGAKGAQGRSRAAQPSDESRMEVLGVVEGQIENIHQELDAQMKRITQLQREVDELRKAMQQLAARSPGS